MKFTDYQYVRPDLTAMKAEMDNLLYRFDNADSVEEQTALMAQINRNRSYFSTMSNLAAIRYSIDTTNPQYEQEQAFFDENTPLFEEINSRYYKSFVNSKFRSELQAEWGEHLFNIAEITLKCFDHCIVEDLQRENHLASEYTKLLASARILFEGEERNLQEIAPFEMSSNRDVRCRAAVAKWQFFAEHTAEFDHIYDELVKTRHNIARKLGFDNFVALGYMRMLRTDYDSKMVAGYRQQVLEVVVPLAAQLRQKQAQRLDIDQLKYYDIPLFFKNGNPKPKGTPEWILNNGKQMYQELSSETAEFFNFMIDKELLDVLSRKGKAPGGYCTYIEDYQSPFIFSNFNGTSDDVSVLTHEAGHAFQVYMSRGYKVPEYYWPTMEACEIHSMSMEFLTWPWMERFFEEDTDKFKYEHISHAILFLPYGVSVDEYQHFVYENPNATPAERKQAWRAIEKKYQPWVDYDGNDFLENGGFWQKQAHIFRSPFYYIDYTLAQICAFQFWHRAENNQQEALTDYINLCKAGGSKPFLQLVYDAKLESPFKNGCLQEVMKPVADYLNTVEVVG